MRRAHAIVILALAACDTGPDPEPADAPLEVAIAFEDRAVPAAFDRRGVGRRTDGGDGLWAVVAGLPRPERGRVRNLDTGEEAVVSLFRAPAGRNPADVALSPAAAELLGIGDTPAPVRVTAVRREPRLVERR